MIRRLLAIQAFWYSLFRDWLHNIMMTYLHVLSTCSSQVRIFITTPSRQQHEGKAINSCSTINAAISRKTKCTLFGLLLAVSHELIILRAS